MGSVIKHLICYIWLYNTCILIQKEINKNYHLRVANDNSDAESTKHGSR